MDISALPNQFTAEKSSGIGELDSVDECDNYCHLPTYLSFE